MTKQSKRVKHHHAGLPGNRDGSHHCTSVQRSCLPFCLVLGLRLPMEPEPQQLLLQEVQEVGTAGGGL